MYQPKMIKIIFLDIDGVIAIPDVVKDGMWGLCDEKQKLIGEIIKRTDAKIVLSSSWRKHDLDSTKEFMNRAGFLFCDKIIGVTIRAYHYIEKGSNIHLSIPRGVEIKQWIDTNIHSIQGKNYNRKKKGVDYNYVILDDDTDMLLEQKDNFIQTDCMLGLSESDMAVAVTILNTIA